MRSCVGCRFLVAASARDVCRADDGPWTVRVDPYSGRRTLEPADRSKSVFRPTLAEMRAPGGKCGPEARLYQPTLFQRFLALFTKRETGE